MDIEYIQESKSLKRLIEGSLFSLIAFTAIAMYAGVLSGSLAILSVALASLLSISLHVFNFFAIRCIIGQNVFNFPMGAGKFENMSACFLGALFIPLSFCIFYGSAERTVHPPEAIDFGMAQIPMLISLARSVWLYLWVRRLVDRYPHCSPMMRSYHLNIKIMFAEDLFILLGLMMGLLMTRAGMINISLMTDVALSVLIGLYMLWSGIRMVRDNFSALVDMPLSEVEQLKILAAISEEFDFFENIGNIYTQLSGEMRIIQIELIFGGAAKLSEIDAIRSRIEKRLSSNFPRLRFHLIPRLNKGETWRESRHVERRSGKTRG